MGVSAKYSPPRATRDDKRLLNSVYYRLFSYKHTIINRVCELSITFGDFENCRPDSLPTAPDRYTRTYLSPLRWEEQIFKFFFWEFPVFSVPGKWKVLPRNGYDQGGTPSVKCFSSVFSVISVIIFFKLKQIFFSFHKKFYYLKINNRSAERSSGIAEINHCKSIKCL